MTSQPRDEQPALPGTGDYVSTGAYFDALTESVTPLNLTRHDAILPCEIDSSKWADSIRDTDTPQQQAQAVLDAALDRQDAAFRCHTCPVFSACAAMLQDAIDNGQTPAGVVVASIAFTEDKMPDPLVHGERAAAALARRYRLTADTGPVIDTVLIDRVLAETEPPSRLNAAEEHQLIVIAAQRGFTVTGLTLLLHRSYRFVRAAAERLEVWQRLVANAAMYRPDQPEEVQPLAAV